MEESFSEEKPFSLNLFIPIIVIIALLFIGGIIVIIINDSGSGTEEAAEEAEAETVTLDEDETTTTEGEEEDTSVAESYMIDNNGNLVEESSSSGGATATGCVRGLSCSATEIANGWCQLAENTAGGSDKYMYINCATGARISYCRRDCTWCGDGKVQTDHNEQCDPGLTTDGTCTSGCLLTYDPNDIECGNGTIDTGEECDPEADPTGCSSGLSCTAACTCSSSVTTLPATGLVNKQVDTLIIGGICIISGLIIYKTGRKLKRNDG